MSDKASAGFSDCPDQDDNDSGGDDEQDFEIDDNSSENKNTKRKTETDMRIFSAYILSLKEKRLAEEIPAPELDRYLTMFFSVVKKHDGNEYEPASLRGMLCSIERYLRMKSYPNSVTRDMVFLNTRNTLKAKQRKLREIGKGVKKSQSESLGPGTLDKLNHLYNAKELGPFNPMSIINSLCFAFVVHFRMRKAIDHKQLLWGDIALRSTSSSEYLCYQPAEGFEHIRPKLKGTEGLKIWAQFPDSQRDPVAVYKLYMTKRPSQTMAPESPFYLGVTAIHPIPTQPWYKTLPMGINKLNDLVRMIREITGIPRATSGSPIESLLTQGAPYMLPAPSAPPPSSMSSMFRAEYPMPGGTAPTTPISRHSKTVPIKIEDMIPERQESPAVEAVDLSRQDRPAARKDTTCSLEDAKEKLRELIGCLESDDVTDFVQWLNFLGCEKNPKTGEVKLNESQSGDYKSQLQLNITIDRKQLNTRKACEITGHAQIRDTSVTEGLTNCLENGNSPHRSSANIEKPNLRSETLSGFASNNVDSAHKKRKRTRSVESAPIGQLPAYLRAKSFPDTMTLNEYLDIMKHSGGFRNVSDAISSQGGLPAGGKRPNMFPTFDASPTKLLKDDEGQASPTGCQVGDRTTDLEHSLSATSTASFGVLPAMIQASMATSQMLASSMFPQFPNGFVPFPDPRRPTLAAPHAAHMQESSLQLQSLLSKMAALRSEVLSSATNGGQITHEAHSSLPAGQSTSLDTVQDLTTSSADDKTAGAPPLA